MLWFSFFDVGCTHLSPVLYFISKPVILFALQIEWLGFIWNATLGWNVLNKNHNIDLS